MASDWVDVAHSGWILFSAVLQLSDLYLLGARASRVC